MPLAPRPASRLSRRPSPAAKLLAGLLLACALSIGGSARSSAESPQADPKPLLQYLPVGSQCHGLLPCEKSGNYGIHFRLLGSVAPGATVRGIAVVVGGATAPERAATLTVRTADRRREVTVRDLGIR